MDASVLDGFRIGVISDTHGLLRPEALDRLAGVQHIVHAGDIGAPGIIEALGKIAPVTAIRGNVDRGDWAAELPETATTRIGGLAVHVLHDARQIAPGVLSSGMDVVISGHTHRPGFEWRDGTLFLNPGSAGPRRFRLPVTVASLTLAARAARPEIHGLFD